jgi:hypothetical protein
VAMALQPDFFDIEERWVPPLWGAGTVPLLGRKASAYPAQVGLKLHIKIRLLYITRRMRSFTTAAPQ